jgi:3-dehydroquinate dehydratase/shikimate dehydrogenase
MSRLTVSIPVRSRDGALAAAALAAERGADLVEYRLDYFAGPPTELTGLVEQSPLPCILTCRAAEEGGHVERDDDARLAFYEHLCTGPRQPAYIDVELIGFQRSPELRRRISALVDHPAQVNATTTGLILSTHDFQGRPADLYQRIEAMAQAPACRVIKVAFKARSLRDNLEVFELLQQRTKPMIALCMGEFGLPSRVLAPKFGGLLTFAALDPDNNTAPGQPTLDELKTLYRWDSLGPDTAVYGVIGWPVGHSLSPHVHNAGFAEASHPGVYLPMPIPPEWEHFKATVGAWIDAPWLHFRGASVTIPHKEHLLRFVLERGGEIEDLTRTIGAANTLTIGDDQNGVRPLFASNSDYAAALDAVCDATSMARDDLKSLRVAVIGAGGAARAIVAGFAHHGATVVVYNRTLERAAELAQAFTGRNTSGGGQVVAARLDKLCDSCCHVFINCTPVGMHPHVDDSPVPPSFFKDIGPGTPGSVVFDTIYNPLQTKLLHDARAAGCVTIPGMEMFVRQAATQFILWTGKAAPLVTFRRVMTDRLMTG